MSNSGPAQTLSPAARHHSIWRSVASQENSVSMRSTSRQFMGLIVLADAISRAKSTDGEKIRDALAATDIPGEQTIMPWKRIKFDDMGQNNDADPVLLQYVGGKFVTIFPPQAAIAEAIWPMK